MAVPVRASLMGRIKRLNLETNAFLQFADSSKIETDAEKIWIGVKDNIMVKGMQLSAGSKIIEGIEVKENATCVQMLEDSGFSVLGKTNMDEFGMGYQFYDEWEAYCLVRIMSIQDLGQL